ncbi:hypothetical protein [Pseudomonas aeruginosa]|jgi:hypothetical protein|uniref:hypothetical protein n=1 Tax=Gammaproteobacteria TaxID=1236 RepID=UPI0018C5058E|nr:hypothetical protein [Pseudomonas aeruginosa]CAG0969421.1 hypothetical protein MTYP_01172 [Methylophilaceae bacterium]MBG5844141.1 hypothetical protein [Pseudomonas aeruginosa]MCH0748026.1 hypothetical protein [Pseudomonas aeruginosa]MDY1289836.1 hypothetical protein [Pseudomonas aeruginosa]HCF4553564.1 hypothetical protein [Pseudomonas aeruginosa]
MSISSAKGMLARLKHLERSRGATDEMRGWVSDMLSAAIADGRMCPVDGPVVRHCVLNWIDDGTARAGTAGWGLLR